ncbi:glycogen-binding domain-containing protein [Pseudodesulfovibrio sediminis]|uniref:AMP-activated protein kinase glycogen-binding domain-containing protein n=1 Tax=Pseudodesulfovibrio sediminis TaxID=2810563 RepID=A0ABN6EP61_9BACT|nr:glycogen-binding domain-containing protein [Pseudodesulfovibrio sediminis]BCS88197.1 hypothetical protein PSDVSF_14390 [Pseudodesulfovibrio sediminis]
MTEETNKILTEKAIIEDIRRAPETAVPEGLTQQVMSRLEPRRATLWTRVRVWMMRPHAIKVRPLEAIPALTIAMALLILTVVKMDGPVPENHIQLSTVRFVLNDAARQASSVAVIGSFNGWSAERSVMWYSPADEAWVLEAELPQGDHEYLFLVNGEKLVPDPGAPLSMDDGFGNRNSIVFVNVEREHVL